MNLQNPTQPGTPLWDSMGLNGQQMGCEAYVAAVAADYSTVGVQNFVSNNVRCYVHQVSVCCENGQQICWGVMQGNNYGLVNYGFQLNNNVVASKCRFGGVAAGAIATTTLGTTWVPTNTPLVLIGLGIVLLGNSGFYVWMTNPNTPLWVGMVWGEF
jgi:hypothetical protein